MEEVREEGNVDAKWIEIEIEMRVKERGEKRRGGQQIAEEP